MAVSTPVGRDGRPCVGEMGESENPKRHCWECLRRCVVCDSTRPACNRCTTAGSACPGYGHVKPTRLVWLAPGKVKSRVRKRKGSPSSPLPALSAEPTGLRGQTHSISVSHAYPSDVVYGSIPRFGADTDADAIVHAAEYCKFYLLQPVAHAPSLPPSLTKSWPTC